MGPYHIAHPRPNKPTRVMAPGSSFSSGYQLHVSRYLYGVVNGFRVYEDMSHIIPSPDTSREAFSDASGLILSTLRMWIMIYDDIDWWRGVDRFSDSRIVNTWNNHDLFWCLYRPVVNNKGHEVLLQLKDFHNVSVFQQFHKVLQKFRHFFMLIFLWSYILTSKSLYGFTNNHSDQCIFTKTVFSYN